MLSSSEESLDAESRGFMSKAESFDGICRLIHLHMIRATHFNRLYDSAILLAQSKAQTVQVLKQMKGIAPSFVAFFVSDLIQRAKATLEALNTEDEASGKNYTANVDENIKVLDPLVLIFLQEKIFELGYTESCPKQLPELIKAFFDMFMSYSIIFNSN